jgi:integrase
MHDYEIRVQVVKYRDRPNYVMRYTDPRSGKQIGRSTGQPTHREALRVAAAWEQKLRSGANATNSRIAWDAFRDRYEAEVYPSQAINTQNLNDTVFNAVERTLRPTKLADLTAERLSFFQAELRNRGLSDASLRTYLAHLRSALKWAVSINLLAAVPNITKPKRGSRTKKMKGRPVTEAEYERMRKATDKVVAPEAVDSWQRLQDGLWLSGLRLSEALQLSWDRRDRLCVVEEGDHLMLAILAEFEKGNIDRTLPIAPEFSLFLQVTPTAERTGPVFPMIDGRGAVRQFKMQTASRIISAIGKAADVVVHRDVRTARVKYASAHDLRRSFGERWSRRVMPQDLKELMRHESVETTLKYYVGVNAQLTTETLWAAYRAQQALAATRESRN